MIKCFGDTYFYLAFINRRDDAHERAVRFIRDHELTVITTTFVLTEVADALACSRRSLFGPFMESLRTDPRTVIVPASQELFETGVKRYLARSDKQWPLTDCISFVVMEDRGITDALTADHHFEQAGFQALLR